MHSSDSSSPQEEMASTNQSEPIGPNPEMHKENDPSPPKISRNCPLQIESSGYTSKKHKIYLEEKSKNLQLPTARQCELTPKYMFEEAVFILHMCYNCRVLNRTQPTTHIDEDYQKIELVLCRICRSTFKSQRNVKFFKHDLQCYKRNSVNE